jgi:DME family drug/metabolite transporter
MGSTKRAAHGASIGAMTNHPLRGVTLVLLAALCWGTTGTAQSFGSGATSAYWVGALRLLVSALFFGLLLAATGGLAAMARLPRGPVLLAGLGMAAYNLAFFAGVKATGVAVGTAVALGSGPIWAGLLQALGGQRPPARWWAGHRAGGGRRHRDGGRRRPGCAAAVGAGHRAVPAGRAVVCRLCAGQCPAGGGAAPAPVTAAVFGLATLIALPAAAWHRRAAATGAARCLVVLWLGLVATGVAYLLFSHALRHIAPPPA